MANTTVKGKFNVVAENGDVQTIYPKTTGDQVLIDRSSNASVIPNDVANLQHIVNKMGSLALKSKVETSDFTTGTMISSLEDLKSNTDTGKIADATVVKDIESRVDTLENSNLVTVDELDAGLATKPDTEINDSVTSTSLTWSSKKLSDQLTTLNSNSNLLKSRVDGLSTLQEGSTTGDAELIDIRTGYDSHIYGSAGIAVREQINDLHNKLAFDFDKIKKYPGYVGGNGIIQKDPNSTRRYTDFIVCGPGVSLKYMGETNHTNVCAIAAYDSDYNVLDYVVGNSERAINTYYNYVTPENCMYIVISYMNASKPGDLKFTNNESYTYNYLDYIFNDYNEKVCTIWSKINKHDLLYNEIMNLDDIKNNKKYYAGGYEYYSTDYLTENSDSMCGTIDVSKYIGCTLLIIRDYINYNNKSARYTIFYDDENKITESITEMDLNWYVNPSNTLMYAELKVSDKNMFISIRKTSEFYVLIKDKHEEIDYRLKNIFVSPNGDDTNNGLTVNTPLKTINEALKRNAENIQLLSGIYYEQINLSNAKNKNINISNYVTTGHVVIKDPHARISTTETKVDGYTNVYSCPFAYGENGISNDNPWLYQENVNDETTLIPSSEVHPLQRGYFYRCRDTKIYRTSSTELLDALNEIDNSDKYKWFHDNTNHILYFSRPHDVDEDHPIATSFAYKLFTGNTRNYTINMTGIEVKYFIFNLENTLNSTITDCKSSNVFGMGAFTYNNCLNIKFIRCEASNCITGRNGDGFNGHGINSSDDVFNKNITATFIDCYAHDNNDDGYSDHEKSETTIIGGLFEYNGKAGITPAQGSHCTCYNVYSRKNCNGFMYINTVSNNEGGNGGQLICYNCYAENNNRSDKTWDHGMGYVVYNANSKIICINCVSENHVFGYAANENTNMTLINCTSINDTNVKTGSKYMTIKNGITVT